MRRRAVVEALSGHLAGAELGEVLKGVDIIGDIAVVKLPRRLEGRGHEVGVLLLQRLGVGAVYRQSSPAATGTKVRGLEWLAGRVGTETRHRESGCDFMVDISKVYFSPRLSYERMRVAKEVRGGEVVVNMFAGVGTFSIVIAKHSGAERVYSIDKSRDAFRYMVENVEVNKLGGRVVPLEGDARDVAQRLQGSADRVLMPLPELALEYLPVAISCLRGRGVVHLYLHQKGDSRVAALAQAEAVVAEGVSRAGAHLTSSVGRVVRSVGRYLFQVVLDIEVVR